MPIKNLTIIGESINDSVPSANALFNANDLDGIVALAKSQDEKGAAYIDVNVGRRSPEFMADLVRRVQRVTSKPLSIDTPDFDIALAGLRAYDKSLASSNVPILNSISPLRLNLFGLIKTHRFMPILMISERVERGQSLPNHSAEQTYCTAKEMLRAARQMGLQSRQLIFDPGIAPIGSDADNNLKRLLDAMRFIHDDHEFAGVHMSVGLSNFTVMLPPKRADGTPVKSSLESAFLTLAMPLGLDMVIGSVTRKYELLPANHPALVCLKECLALDGFDVVMRVKDFYS